MVNLGYDLAVQETLARGGLSTTSEGECVEVDYTDNVVVVNVGGGEIVMPWVGEPPMVGDRVQVGYLGQKPVCLGVKYGSTVGTVQTSPGTGTAVVVGEDGTKYEYGIIYGLGGVDPAATVRLDHAARLIVAVITVPAPPPAEDKPAPPKPPASTIKSRWFKPTNSGNYRFGNFHSGPAEVSDNRLGVYWYGTQIRDSIPNGATILEAKMVLRQNWDNVPGVDSRLRMHKQTSPGGTPPFVGGAFSIPGGSRTIGLSIVSIANQLKQGAAYGVAFQAGYGWRQYATRATSGQIFIRWRT